MLPRRTLARLRVLTLATLAGSASLASSSPASADLDTRLSKIAALRADVAKGGSTNAYVALREIWQTWDDGDPADVEEALRSLSADPSVAPPLKAYAGLLEAYARRRRGDLDGAKKIIERLGFVRAWNVVGPFDNEGKAGFERPFEPEVDPEGPASKKAIDGKERPVRWRTSPTGAPFGWLDLGVLLRPAEKICGYATTYVRDDRLKKGANRTISLWLGSAGAARVFWNGKDVLHDDKYRSLDADRRAVGVTLESGWNRVLVKACGDEDAPLFSLRVADERGGPDPKIEISADPAHQAESADKKGKAVAGRVSGPLDAFERAAQGGDAATLEAFARYLTLSQGDDPSERKARLLARRAAEKAPTVKRLLLAGELAEDRNQRAVWIERAEALVRTGGRNVSTRERIEALLARAAHARSGVYFRDAMPFYDRVLEMDPDEVAAVLARFELYAEADLKDTGAALLQRAVARRPKSVALLRALASALRQQGRTTEAVEIEERYAQLRFDDPGYLRDRVELAVAQRDQAGAVRWVDRLLAVTPDQPATLAWAAKAYLQLGQPASTRALPLLARSLELAPEDVEAMRALADVHGVLGHKDEQLRLLRQLLVLRPQAKEVREYLAHLEPERPRPDEAYARPPEEFLKGRNAPAGGVNQRTLSSLKVTTVYPNGLASRFHQIVWQPLTESAATESRSYGFSYEADSETVQMRGARVHRKDGRIEEALDVGEGPANDPGMAMYTSARSVYVQFPRIDVGDVVELRYRIEGVSSRNDFADYFGEVTTINSNEPISRNEYVLITPKSRQFYFNEPRLPGIKRTVEERGNERIYRFLGENLAPLDPEPMQPPWSEVLGYVHVSTYKSWEDVGRWYWGLVRDQFAADDEVKRRAQELTKGLTDNRSKVSAVYDWVVQKTRYVALEFGIHGYKPYRCAQIFARGFGDCKDKATLIVTMLKELGINATIVIVRTGMRGDIDPNPASLAPFDHAIAYVPEFDLYLDGTAEWTGSNELPGMDRGAVAMQINEGKTKLVRLPDPPSSESVTARNYDVTLSGDGNAQIDFRAEVSGVAAPSWRERYHAESTRKARVQEDLAGDLAGFEIAEIQASNLENLEQKVSLRVKGKAPRLVKRENNAFSMPVGPRESMVREYAALSRRRQDVRLRAKTTQEHLYRIKLAPGMQVIQSPPPAEGNSPFGTYKVTVENEPGVVKVKTRLTMDKTRITAPEYPAFRAFCEAADKALGQRLTVSAK